MRSRIGQQRQCSQSRRQRFRGFRRSASLELLEPRLPLDSTTVINELMYAPLADQPEWIELHNQLAVDMDLSGWSLANGIDYQFPDGTVIEGHGYLLISSQPEMQQHLDPLGPFRGRLSNGGERIELLDNNARLMSVVDYQDDGDWPVGADRSGATLAKSDEGLATEPAVNWRSSARVGGTPGEQNFPAVAKSESSILAFDTTWRFNDTGIDLGNNWHAIDYNDVTWSVGQGLFWDGVETLPFQGNTELRPAQDTYYFRTKFDYQPGDRTPTELLLSPLVEDGAVFYLNGVEVLRSNLPEGPITFATAGLAELELEGTPEAVSLPLEHLRVGQNVIGVEVHQASTVFDVEIKNGSFEANASAPLFAPTDWEGAGFLFNSFTRVTQLDMAANPSTRLPYPDGSQAIVMRSDDGETMEIFQDLGSISAGTYQLNYSVADRFTAQWLNYRVELLAVDGNSEVQLFSASSSDQSSLRPVNGSSSHASDLVGREGDWRDVVLQAVARPVHAGKTLRLKFVTDVRSSGDTGEHFELAIDKVEMTVDREVVPDVVFGLGLDVVEILPTAPKLQFNEVAGSEHETFFVELINSDLVPVELSNVELWLSDITKVTLPQRELRAGEIAVFDVNSLGFAAADGDRLFLMDPAGNVLDARAVDRVGRGIHQPSHDWLVVAAATPNATNRFALRDDVVISEIMYHSAPDLAKRPVDGVFETSSLVSFDAPWRYLASGADLGASWQNEWHPIAGDWQQGIGLLGYLPPGQSPPLPVGTELIGPAESRVRTHYFETEITLTAAQLANFQEIELRHIVDDGAVFFINGVEVLRYQMPAGTITASTLASTGVGDVAVSEVVLLAADLFSVGTNRLSVEVHQVSSFSTDMLFGLELTGRQIVEAAVPGVPFRENPLEWIELYNKSEVAVDLTGWQLDDAISYEFAEGTTLQPGAHLVVASDVATMLAEYPGLLNIVGDFSGSLSNRSERIQLLDAIGNPADEVQYFDDGLWDPRADGAGPSLELIDPRADNANGLAWMASHESAKSEWQTYTYRGIPERTIPGEPTVWREFAFGFLDGAGEALIDDLSVVEDPDGAARELIQNGAFNQAADHFRLLGNHQRSAVIDDGGNAVLHLVSSGAAEYQGNQVETTFVNNSRLQQGTEYEVTFRAKWLSGSRQLNSRFYFNQLPKTTALSIPNQSGTPGQQNSRFQSNAGPTIDRLQHQPVLPAAGEAINVSVEIADPDRVAAVKLWYRVDGTPWVGVSMTAAANGVSFAASLPGQDAGAVVQFYVEATDARQATSVYPRTGPDSRALIQVDDGRGNNDALTRFRLIMLEADVDQLHNANNVLSNERLGATVLSGNDVYFDVGVRLKGSFVGRDALRVGFNVAFNPDHLFRGVHDKVSVDRSTHANLGVDEILLKHTASHAGGIPSMYDDLIDFVAPRAVNTGTASLRMAGFDEVYLDSQYTNGSEGTVYEYEVLRWATTTIDGNLESVKRAGGLGAPNGYANVEIQDLGDDKEAYRWTNLLVSNRSRDDYATIMAMGKAFSQTGDAQFQQTREVLDIDQWMRTAAFQSLFQPGDSYFTGSNLHNFRIYVRPDGKVQYMPWDWDSAFQGSFRAPLVGGAKLGQIVRHPENLRLYYGHMLDIVERAFNPGYLADWTDHYGELAGQRFAARLTFVDRRSSYVVEQINSDFPHVPFNISTPSGQRIDETVTVVEGTGWVDVREIRLAETGERLDVKWIGSPNADRWQVMLPVEFGRHQYTLEARDFHGNRVGAETIEIESTVSERPLRQFLRITEINYNPNGDDATEFIELANVSSGAAAVSLDLSGVTLVEGPSAPFVIADGVRLGAGEFLLVVKDRVAFSALYPAVNSSLIAGEFAGSLSNSGERVTVLDSTGSTILDVDYRDGGAWPARADGAGGTLVLSDPAGTPAAQVEDPRRWRGSTEFGGSPGRASARPIGIAINEVLVNTNAQNPLETIELFNSTNAPIDLSGWFLSDSSTNFEKFRIPNATIVQPSQFLVIRETEYNPTPGSPLSTHFGLSGTNGDDLWLVSDLKNGQRQFVDDVHFGPSLPGESLSWFENGPGSLIRTAPTLGQTNSAPLLSSLIVSEINFAPVTPTAAALQIDNQLSERDLEFVEIYNRSAAPVSLQGVRIGAGIEFDFIAPAELAARESIVVVSFDPRDAANRLRTEAFRQHYQIDDSIRLVGGFRNRLSNTGDRVELTVSGAPFGIGDYVVEQIAYDDETSWPVVTTSGDSLQRASDQTSGAFSASWIGQRPTPGRVTFAGSRPGDFTGDGQLDVRDVDRLWAHLRLGMADPAFDLTGDGQVDAQDRDRMIFGILGTSYGDANLNRRFDSSDFVLVFVAGEYEDAIVGNSTWQSGDWNADGDFTTADLVLAFSTGTYVANSEQQTSRLSAAVDEVFALLPSRKTCAAASANSLRHANRA